MITDKQLDDMVEMADMDDWSYISQKNMRMALQELKERRESDLKPADKFLETNSIEDQMEHIDSEYAEVDVEYKKFQYGEEVDPDRLIEELIDLQTSCETMLARLGLDENQRREARKRVIAKNAARGYYEKVEQ